MKRVVAMVVSAFMLFSLAGCGAGASGSAQQSSQFETQEGVETILIGNALSNLDESNKRIVTGIEQYVEEYNATHDDSQIEVITTDAQSSMDKQLSDVESLITQGCDAIILSSVDTVGGAAAVEAIHNAGIISVDWRGTESDLIDIRSGDWEAIQIEISKNWLKNYLEENPDVVLNFGIILGAPAQADQLRRADFVRELAEEMPDRVKILDEKYGNWSTAESQTITEDWMQSLPEMNAICAASDDTALGAINVLSTLGRIDDFVVTSYDGTANGLNLVKDGKLDMTVRGDSEKMAATWAEVCVKAVKGEFTGDTIEYDPSVFVAVDSENVDEYVAG